MSRARKVALCFGVTDMSLVRIWSNPNFYGSDKMTQISKLNSLKSIKLFNIDAWPVAAHHGEVVPIRIDTGQEVPVHILV